MIRRLLGLALALGLAQAQPAFAQSSSLDLPGMSQSTTAPASNFGVPGAHSLLGATITPTCPNGCFALFYDSAVAIADGPVTPALCLPIPPPVAPMTQSSVSMANTPSEIVTQNGIWIAVSSTGCFVQTSIGGAYIEIAYQ